MRKIFLDCGAWRGDSVKKFRDENKDAKDSFELANQVEEIHHGLFNDFLEKLDKGETPEEKPIYVCQYCGNTVEGEAPEKCPVCGVSKKMFKNID